MTDHPVKVPQGLIEKWMDDWFEDRENADVLLIQAVQYGADQELEACCEWLNLRGLAISSIDALHTARRPKSPTLAEQALEELESIHGDAYSVGMGFDAPAIRAALTRLAELEAQQ
jgi:hypothetical protein